MSSATLKFVESLVDKKLSDAYIKLSLKASYPDMERATMDRYISIARARAIDEKYGKDARLMVEESKDWKRWNAFHLWTTASIRKDK